ncbi:MAG: 16S rRNA (uracil(1498)-N(3))-methyltransferase [Hydrogenoanaerobacterium sp.]
MPRFFVDTVFGDTITISGNDAAHIRRVLRMNIGDKLVVCSTATDTEYFCKIKEFTSDTVLLTADSAQQTASEPSVRVKLFQALPKADKMETIIQKAVELGVYEITPVITRRCVSRPDEKSLIKKEARWQKIAEEASKQCGRGIIPNIQHTLEYEAALKELAKSPLSVLFYELGGSSLKALLQDCPNEVSIIIGAEGGFDEAEVLRANAEGIKTASLGKRILRCETAPLCALSAIMYETGNLD